MTINSFALYISNRIQEVQQITIEKLAQKNNCSPATIRRTVHALNEYLTPAKQFIITESKIINQLSYQEFVQFIQQLTIIDYSTSWNERLTFLIGLSMIEGYTNLSKLYDLLAISQSTKKKDRPIFLRTLEKEQLNLHSLRGKGVTVTGDELTLRIKTTLILSRIIEFDEENQIIPRQANNPLEQMLFAAAEPIFQADTAKEKLASFLTTHQLAFNYTSMKFLSVYYLLSLHRQSGGFWLTEKTAVPVQIRSYPVFQHEAEDFACSTILASLDNGGTFYPEDELVARYSEQLVAYVEERVYATFYSKDRLEQEIEQYLYKSLLRNALNFDFYDNKLDDVKKEFSFLYQLVDYFYQTFLAENITLDTYQLGTLTLIFREHVLKNKIAGRNLKHVVVITNSAKEKSNFFSQQLVYHFDTKVIAILNLNEIHQLKYLTFDNLITFSNRISTILNENGFPNIKVNYYFHQKDIDHLTKLNFSNNSHRKLIAEHFAAELQTVSVAQLADYLKEYYPNFFV